MKNLPSNLSNLNSKVDKLDVDKLVPISVDLSQLSDVVKNYFGKKDVHNAKVKDIEDKVPNITNLATNTILNSETNLVKEEIPSTTNIATITALTAKINKVKNEITSIFNLATNTKHLMLEI